MGFDFLKNIIAIKIGTKENATAIAEFKTANNKVNKITIKIKISPKKTKVCTKRAFLKTNPLNVNNIKAKKARKI